MDVKALEDSFSTADFEKLVLKDAKANITKVNSEFMKNEKISKVITARDFMIEVNEGKITLVNLVQGTTVKIEKLLTNTISTLS